MPSATSAEGAPRARAPGRTRRAGGRADRGSAGAAGGRARRPSAGFSADPDAPPARRAGAGIARSRPRRRSSDLLGDPRPRVALRGVARRAGQALAALGVEREVAQRLGQRRRVAARDEHAVAAVGHDVGVAGDVRGHDRRAGRERLRQHHAEATRRRATARRAGPPRAARLALRVVGDLARARDAAAVEQHAARRRRRRADDLSSPGRARAAPRRRAAAPAAPCARRPGRRRRSAAARPEAPAGAAPAASGLDVRRRWG